ncbi:hypothetical protein GCM10010121_042380 [Streptomyces brasiliensis]|uniref:Uncharacterized protein n=1 Tax=Streptomyces brasiliensis TaxID=1954 RepID=A0A917NSZ8_9ACTN|nr:hypothetical protein GCM10010121_042380 [Streptomyces brasiliensis]
MWIICELSGVPDELRDDTGQLGAAVPATGWREHRVAGSRGGGRSEEVSAGGPGGDGPPAETRGSGRGGRGPYRDSLSECPEMRASLLAMSAQLSSRAREP